MGFNYDPAGGDKYIGRVIQAREAKARDWDQLRAATLSKDLGEEGEIFLLEVVDLESPPNSKTRAYFMTSETSSVSKWTRFKISLNKLEPPIRIVKSEDGGTNLEGMTLNIEEKMVEMGKYGLQPVVEVTGIPTDAEITALLQARGELSGAEAPKPKAATKAAPKAATAKAAAIVTDSEKATAELDGLFLKTVDGMTKEEAKAALEVMGLSEEQIDSCFKNIPRLVMAKLLKVGPDKKFIVPE